jgi:hypothetical protein
MYYSMPINMFFIVKNHWEPSFADNPRVYIYIYIYARSEVLTAVTTKIIVFGDVIMTDMTEPIKQKQALVQIQAQFSEVHDAPYLWNNCLEEVICDGCRIVADCCNNNDRDIWPGAILSEIQDNCDAILLIDNSQRWY